jgi:hypothetical protein
MDWPLFVGHMHFIEALASILKSSPASSCPVSSGLIDLFLSEAYSICESSTATRNLPHRLPKEDSVLLGLESRPYSSVHLIVWPGQL